MQEAGINTISCDIRRRRRHNDKCRSTSYTCGERDVPHQTGALHPNEVAPLEIANVALIASPAAHIPRNAADRHAKSRNKLKSLRSLRYHGPPKIPCRHKRKSVPPSSRKTRIDAYSLPARPISPRVDSTFCSAVRYMRAIFTSGVSYNVVSEHKQGWECI